MACGCSAGGGFGAAARGEPRAPRQAWVQAQTWPRPGGAGAHVAPSDNDVAAVRICVASVVNARSVQGSGQAVGPAAWCTAAPVFVRGAAARPIGVGADVFKLLACPTGVGPQMHA
ncbi:unnamed protein product [Prorocentrum cordatum]|uniref:Uncharacterized protein n=1 Tax=Prorocentrum cordatum TaxID=2364126 RepID=A0ABN9VAC9_9DINO|nr:unnamed protein product [Polarella glacialis]